MADADLDIIERRVHNGRVYPITGLLVSRHGSADAAFAWLLDREARAASRPEPGSRAEEQA